MHWCLRPDCLEESEPHASAEALAAHATSHDVSSHAPFADGLLEPPLGCRTLCLQRIPIREVASAHLKSPVILSGHSCYLETSETSG
jgi:hypothetical protein